MKRVGGRRKKPSEEMERPYSEKELIRARSNVNGLQLNFWEFSDNYYYDSLYTGFYTNLMCGNGNGLHVICFDLGRFLTQQQNSRRSLVYYFTLVKQRPDTKLMLVGLKLDRISSQQEMQSVNAEVKRCAKDLDVKGIMYNKEAKLLFFPVDNHKQYGIKTLRRKVEVAVKSRENVKRNMRLKELCLLDLLTCEKFDEHGKIIASLKLDEVKFWAKSLKIEDDALSFLLELYHQSGYILHFPRSRTMRDVVICDVDWCLDSVRHLLNNKMIHESYNILYSRIIQEEEEQRRRAEKKKTGRSRLLESRSYVDDDDESLLRVEDAKTEGDNSAIEEEEPLRYIVNQTMVRHIINEATESDVEAVLNLMKDHFMISDWQHDVERFPGDDESPCYFLPTLMNNKETIYEHTRPRDTDSMDESMFDDLDDLPSKLKYQVYLEVSTSNFFPTSFYTTFACGLVQFLSKFKEKLDRVRRRNKDQTFKKVDILLHQDEETNLVVMEVNIGSLFRFFVRPEMNGLSFFVAEEDKKGAYGSFIMFKAMVQRVNLEILKLRYKFETRVGIYGDLESLRRKYGKGRKPSMSRVLEDLVQAKTFHVSGISGIEHFLRNYT